MVKLNFYTPYKFTLSISINMCTYSSIVCWQDNHWQQKLINMHEIFLASVFWPLKSVFHQLFIKLPTNILSYYLVHVLVEVNVLNVLLQVQLARSLFTFISWIFEWWYSVHLLYSDMFYSVYYNYTIHAPAPSSCEIFICFLFYTISILVIWRIYYFLPVFGLRMSPNFQ